MAKSVGILGLNVLDGLSVLPVDVDSDDGLVEIGVGRLDDRVVDVVQVAECVESFEDKLEESLQVLRRGRSDEDVAVAVCNRRCNRHTQSCGLSSSSACSQSDSAREGLL